MGASKVLLVLSGLLVLSPVTIEDMVLGRDEGRQPKRRNPKEHLIMNKRNHKCVLALHGEQLPQAPDWWLSYPGSQAHSPRQDKSIQLASQEALP